MAKQTKKLNYNDLSDVDLKNRARDLQAEYIAGQQKARMGQFKKTSEFSRLRKEVARCFTHLRARELKAAKG